MNLSDLDGGLIVTSRFLRLLPKFVPYLREIRRCTGYVVGDVLIPEGEDHTPYLRMVLPPSLAKDILHFVSFPTIHGGEILEKVAFLDIVLFVEGNVI